MCWRSSTDTHTHTHTTHNTHTHTHILIAITDHHRTAILNTLSQLPDGIQCRLIATTAGSAKGEILALGWVHTCNVYAFRNTATLQVTHTIRSYDLNFHPVPHGVTVSCKRYTRLFPGCYGSPSDVVFAASSGFVHLYTLRFKGKEKRAAIVAKATVHKQGSVQRFTFDGRLEFSVDQWVIQEFHQNVSQWIWIFN
jgi:hypothetical protein